jgi:hypothetical protein
VESDWAMAEIKKFGKDKRKKEKKNVRPSLPSAVFLEFSSAFRDCR